MSLARELPSVSLQRRLQAQALPDIPPRSSIPNGPLPNGPIVPSENTVHVEIEVVRRGNAGQENQRVQGGRIGENSMLSEILSQPSIRHISFNRQGESSNSR